MPTMPKTRKTNAQSAATLPIFGKAAMIDETSTGIPGTRFSARSGRSARTERITE